METETIIGIMVIIAIGVAIFFLWPYISQYVGSLNSPVNTTPKYSNDIITVENFEISDPKPYTGYNTTISFYIKNNCDKTVDSVEVIFSNVDGKIPGFKNSFIDCEPPANKLGVGEYGCNISDMETLETRRVTLILTTEDIKESPQSFPISYTISYNHSGHRIANIPIINESTRKTSLGKFSVSSPDYSPIVLDFELVSKTGGVYYGIAGQPLRVTFNLKDVVGKDKLINISKGNIVLNLTDLEIDKNSFCDFDYSGASNKSILVPGDLVCLFINSNSIAPEVSATIKTEFNYTYEFTNSKTIEVQPLPESI